MTFLNRVLAMIAGPLLFLSWINTGEEAYFKFFSVVVALGTIALASMLLYVNMMGAQNQSWSSPALQEFLGRFAIITYIGWALNITMILYLIVHHKVLIGLLVLFNLTIHMYFRHAVMREERYDL